MGAKFCFFTDPAKLKPQSANGAFGPLAADQGKDRFRVTHRHEVDSSGAPAIAVCDGILCAQMESSGALTLILKPSQTPPFESPVVSYFVYKGIVRASLLAGNAVLDETHAEANDLTRRVAATWKAQNDGDLTGSTAGLGLDRDGTFLHDPTDAASKVFADGDPVARLFTYPHPKFQLPIVKAGDWIGAFSAACGFEIVLLRLGYQPELSFVRQADNVMEVPSLPVTNGGTPWQPDDYDFFVHWHAKEQALAYLDPAAYFGGFAQARLYKSDGTDADRVKGKDVYDEILATFANRNVAWLDIRNNYGYSYNLFGLYADSVRFISRNDPSDSNDLGFRGGGWPLLRLHLGDVPGVVAQRIYRTALCLPAGASLAPAVLLSKGFAHRLGSERPGMKSPAIAANAADPNYLTPVRIAFPATDDGGQAVLTASYTRVNLYERGISGSQAQTPLHIGNAEHLDGVFRPRELQLKPDFGGHNLRFEIYYEETLVDLEDRCGPVYSACVGIAEDSSNVTLFAFPDRYLGGPKGAIDRRPLPSWADVSDNQPGEFIARMTAGFRYTRIAKRKISPAGLSHDVDAPIVRHEASIKHNPATDKNVIHDYVVLIMPKPVHQALLATIATGPAEPGLPAFLKGQSAEKYDSTNDEHYLEFEIQCAGFETGGGGKAVRTLTPLSKMYEHALP